MSQLLLLLAWKTYQLNWSTPGRALQDHGTAPFPKPVMSDCQTAWKWNSGADGWRIWWFSLFLRAWNRNKPSLKYTTLWISGRQTPSIQIQDKYLATSQGLDPQKLLSPLLCHCVRCCLQDFQGSNHHFRRPSLSGVQVAAYDVACS